MTLKLKLGMTIPILLVFLISGCAGYYEPPVNTATPEKAPLSTLQAIPTVQLTPPICSENEGSVERVRLTSDLMVEDYEVSIYTPPCYEEEVTQTYPVLYLLHGQSMEDTFWGELGVAQMADALIKVGSVPFIIVMPREVRNYDPVLETKYPESLMTELLPWVESHYPVCTGRECRAIGGVSRGGGWAMVLGLQYFETFSSIGAHSMGLMPGNGSRLNKLKETLPVESYPRFYIDRGVDDYMAVDIDFFEGELTRLGIPHEYHLSPGRHEKAYWQAHLADYLEWYAAGWKK